MTTKMLACQVLKEVFPIPWNIFLFLIERKINFPKYICM